MRSTIVAPLIAALLCLQAAAQAQQHGPPSTPRPSQPAPPWSEGEIGGTVVSAASGEPVARASVTLRSAADSQVVSGVFSGSGGAFRVRGLPAGRYLVRAGGGGFLPLTKLVIVSRERPSLDAGTFSLRPAVVVVEGVTAQGQRSAVSAGVDRNSYSVRGMPVAAGGNATDVLRTIPEVDVDGEGSVRMLGSADVVVHLNGRPAPVRGEALTAFLRQLPASRIDRIEVIPNPSARYDPEGMSGIINIVLRDDAGLGLSGSLTSSIDSWGRPGGGANLAFQRGRLTTFLSANANWGAGRARSSDFRENFVTTPVTWVSAERRNDNTFASRFADASLEYRIAPRSTLLGSARVSGSDHRADVLSLIAVTGAPSTPLQRYDQLTDSRHGNDLLNLMLGVRRVVRPGQHELTAELRRVHRLSGQRYAFERTIYLPGDPAESGVVEGSRDTDVGFDETVLQADFMQPLGARNQLHAGLQMSGRGTEYGQVIDDAAAGSAFGYSEVYRQAYLLLTRTFGRVSVQGGARGEMVETRLSSTGTADFHNDYRTLYPSVMLSYTPGQGSQARLAYSKRVERPHYEQLNPFVYASDSLNRFTGNPHLRPKFTHSFTLDLTRTRGAATLKLSPFFRRTIDNWDQFRTVDSSGVSTMTMRNAGPLTSSGATSSGTFRWGGTSSLTAALTGYRYSRDEEDDALARQGFRWQLSGNALVGVRPGWDVQATARYSSPMELPQGRMGGTVFTSAGLRRKLGDRLVANATVTDPFALHRSRMETRDASHAQVMTFRPAMRSARLALTYTFGKRPQSARREPAPETQASEMETVQ
jgi:hypothetical protein